MSRTTPRWLILVTAAALGCGTPPTGSDAGADAGVDAGSGGTGGAGGSGGTGGGQADAGHDAGTPIDAGTTALVFNELAAVGDDFVELFNPSTAAVDLSAWGLTDSASDGTPKLTSMVRFPIGTSVAPHGFLVVMFEAVCPDAGFGDGGVPCFESASGISQPNGEAVHLLNTLDQVVKFERYPANAADAGYSWGRLPDGTGSFQVLTRTPGGPNTP